MTSKPEIAERRADQIGAAVVAVLAHLGDQHPRLAAEPLGDRVGPRDRRPASASSSRLPVNPAHRLGRRVIAAERALQRVGNLAERAARARGRIRSPSGEQIRVRRLRARFQRIQRRAHLRLVARRPHLLQPRDLARADPGIVDLEEVVLLLLAPAGSG